MRNDWWGWIPTGEPATAWQSEPARPIINLEPNYEYHLDQSDLTRCFDPFDVRRAVYWSLLVSPMAGVTYGGHGVWGWDDGTRPAGEPSQHRRAFALAPGAHHARRGADCPRGGPLFGALPWWRLRPAPELIVVQPGLEAVGRFIIAAASDEGDLAVVYMPGGEQVVLNLAALRPGLQAEWFSTLCNGAQPGGTC